MEAQESKTCATCAMLRRFKAQEELISPRGEFKCKLNGDWLKDETETETSSCDGWTERLMCEMVPR